MSSHTNMITWHEISKEVNDYELPDAETEVLIFDDYLDDVVLGYLDERDGGVVWIEATSDDPLLSPRMWAEKPFPLGV